MYVFEAMLEEDSSHIGFSWDDRKNFLTSIGIISILSLEDSYMKRPVEPAKQQCAQQRQNKIFIINVYKASYIH